ncbi:UTP--glucose-1-phosphate uridylyltransferase [Sphingomonas koreensis]|uniref:UTP--glucose-1-phosphate uridylyltransferase n=1 Tax=Sphingomonas koreensis TaxID=93064 RepID=A0A2M8WFW7_9SPHN|nr:UTP--glucose-1-phosphate uridylyltransferase GalU [Sphingomonas koreensis]PJI89813.1 UTP--glucose-1-phosphate uridylyltransferase [Sphingomonas koreensis]RSU61960.1 UTP--glucose-1-phosphate uridylyltransferase [Sphingomonas koreensis]RSU70614.1 UTP--glucose-1-phosphate uridylyltransferase [Sphingomonas koreensis]RSY82039.1 UTP--glucose-1-phosphate uridylyltransferase [Sphingomonas koreensis]
MTIKPLRKAVFPVGGLGTRFLPATKALPKEMLPVVDRPLIQYAVDEALEAGIEQIIFVTGRGKSAIEDHFDISYELETTMAARGKPLDVLDGTRLKPGAIAYVRQQEPMGLGHAVWCARDIVGDEPFAVLLADDFMVSAQGQRGCLRQMVEAYNKVGGNLLCAQQVAEDQTDKYGVITPGTRDGTLTEVKGLVEKPKAGTAPSNLAVIGRYILQPEVMRVLEGQEKGAGGEIQLTDAMARMIGGQPFHGVTFQGVRYDCGDKAGYAQANLALALSREDIGPAVREFAKGLLG